MKRLLFTSLSCLLLVGCVNELKVKTTAYRQHCLGDNVAQEKVWFNDFEQKALYSWKQHFAAAEAIGEGASQELCADLKQSIKRELQSISAPKEDHDE